MYKLFHNPRCSKSRAALQLLEETKIDFQTVLYLENPLSKSEISVLVDGVIGDYHHLIRKGEEEFRQSGKELTKMSKSEVTQFLFSNGRCMERPILSQGNRCVIGRPTERLNLILDQ